MKVACVVAVVLLLVVGAAACDNGSGSLCQGRRRASELLQGWVPVRPDALNALDTIDKFIYLTFGDRTPPKEAAIPHPALETFAALQQQQQQRREQRKAHDEEGANAKDPGNSPDADDGQSRGRSRQASLLKSGRESDLPAGLQLRSAFPLGEQDVRYIATDEYEANFDAFPDKTAFSALSRSLVTAARPLSKRGKGRGAPLRSDEGAHVSVASTAENAAKEGARPQSDGAERQGGQQRLQQQQQRQQRESSVAASSTAAKALGKSAGPEFHRNTRTGLLPNRLSDDTTAAGRTDSLVPPPEIAAMLNRNTVIQPISEGTASIIDVLIERGSLEVVELETLHGDQAFIDRGFYAAKHEREKVLLIKGTRIKNWPHVNWTMREWDEHIGRFDVLSESTSQSLIYWSPTAQLAQSQDFWETPTKPNRALEKQLNQQFYLPASAIPFWKPPAWTAVDVGFPELEQSRGTSHRLYGFTNLRTPSSLRRVFQDDLEAAAPLFAPAPSRPQAPDQHPSSSRKRGRKQLQDTDQKPDPTTIAATLWVATNHATTNAHFDASSTFHAMIKGRKRFYFFEPEEMLHLYTTPPYHPSYPGTPVCLSCSRSAEEVEEILEQQPELLKIKRVHIADIGPGDAVAFPAYWIHEVASLDDFIVSISSGLSIPEKQQLKELNTDFTLLKDLRSQSPEVAFLMFQAYFTDVAFAILSGVPGETGDMCTTRLGCITNFTRSVLHRIYEPLGVLKDGFRRQYPCTAPLSAALERIETESKLAEVYRSVVVPAVAKVKRTYDNANDAGAHRFAQFHQLLHFQLSNTIFHWAEVVYFLNECLQDPDIAN